MAIAFSQQRRTASDIGAWLDLEPVDNHLSQVAWSNHRGVPQELKPHFSFISALSVYDFPPPLSLRIDEVIWRKTARA